MTIRQLVNASALLGLDVMLNVPPPLGAPELRCTLEYAIRGTLQRKGGKNLFVESDPREDT